MFPKLWNAFEIELKETESAKKILNQTVSIFILRIMRGLNTENLVVFYMSRFYIKN